MSLQDWRYLLGSPEIPALLPKPCHDCAVANGFYQEPAERLAQEDPATVELVKRRWDCHNHLGRARCKGLDEFLAKPTRVQ